MKKEYCEYFLVHTKEGDGDLHVFNYFNGDSLMCDNYGCRYGNNNGEKIFIELESPVGICLSDGLKERLNF